MTPLKQQISFIPFSIEKGDNTLQEIAEMSIAAIVLSLLSSFFIEKMITLLQHYRKWLSAILVVFNGRCVKRCRVQRNEEIKKKKKKTVTLDYEEE